MADISLLKKKLASYSAIAAGVIALAAEKSEGQIIYYDITPDVQLDSANNTYLLDLDNNGVFDFKFNYKQTYLGLGASSYGKILPYNSNKVIGYADKLVAIFNEGEIISSVPPYASYSWANNQLPLFTYDSFHYGEMGWVNVTGGFAAIVFKQPDGNHYGWIRMTHEYDGGYPTPLIIEDFAYQTHPDSAIFAGEISVLNHVADNESEVINVYLQDHQLHIRFNQSPLPSQVILFNALGVKLREAAITQNETVMDVSELAMGVYFIWVEDESERRIKRILIE